MACSRLLPSLSHNHLGAKGAAALAPALAANGSLTSLDLAQNQLCGLDKYGDGTYTAEGITAFADAMRVNGGLTALDLSNNHLNEEGKTSIRNAVQGKACFQLQL